MVQAPFDAQRLIDLFASTTAGQGEQLKTAVSQAMLQALQGRALTLENIGAAMKSVMQAASAGAAKNALPELDIRALLGQAFAGIDSALLGAVEANRVALTTLAAQGADLRDTHLKKAVDDLDKLQDTMFAAIKEAAQGAAAPVAGAWGSVLEKMRAEGTLSGTQAAGTVEQLTQQMQGAVRSAQQTSLDAAQALTQGYTAMVTGVLMGMSEALAARGTPGTRAGNGTAAKGKPGGSR